MRIKSSSLKVFLSFSFLIATNRTSRVADADDFSPNSIKNGGDALVVILGGAESPISRGGDARILRDALTAKFDGRKGRKLVNVRIWDWTKLFTDDEPGGFLGILKRAEWDNP